MKQAGTALPGDCGRVAVLGAGYVGAAVAAAIVRAGAGAWAVSRSGRTRVDGVVPVAADLGAGARFVAPPDLPERLDAVVLAVAPGPGASYEGTYPPAARAALALAEASGARCLVYTSSTGVYGGRDGQWVDEDSPREGAGPGNDALREAEDVLLGPGRPGTTVLRVAGIYGPGRDPRPRYADPARLPLRGEYWVNLAHRDDIVAAITVSLGHRGGARVLNVADGSPATAAELARWCAAGRGEDPAALEFTCEAAPARSNQRVDSGRLRAEGWLPAYPSFREGFSRGV